MTLRTEADVVRTLRRGTYLRGYDYDFIALFAPHLSRRVVTMAMQGGGAEYQL